MTADVPADAPGCLHPDLVAVAAVLAAGSPSLTDAGEDVDAVATALYPWYLNATPLPEPVGELRPADVDLPAALNAAHAGAAVFRGGWRVTQVLGGGTVVATQKTSPAGSSPRVLGRAQYVVAGRPGAAAREGDALLASSAWTWVDPDTGFWHTRWGAWPPPDQDRLVRTYLNVAPSDAPRALAALTAVLTPWPDVPFQAKTPAATDHGGRADALVLYLGGEDAGRLDSALRHAVGGLVGILRPLVPRFTRVVAPGVGQADGPVTGDSFGEQRCRLAARAWLALPAHLRAVRPELEQMIARQLTAAGLDPSRPDRGVPR